ncbi:MAG: hypothetical protein JKY03_07490 [Aureispira sp.]|nr:hypothetical protein [Aureispira sp.]
MHSIPKKILLLSLFVTLSVLSACNSVEGETKDAAAIKFDEQVEILKIADKCLDEEIPVYTKENTWFYELGTNEDSLMLLVETYVGCGYTGSCGNRILLVIGTEMKWSFCGLLDHVSDSLVNGGVKSFFLTNRGYQTGKLKHRHDWNGVDFDSKNISRNNIPWDILRQLPLDKEACKSSNYDCFAVEEIELQELEIGVKGEKGILVSPRYTFFDNNNSTGDKEYWLFKVEEKEQYQLLNKFQNVSEFLLTRNSKNGHYNIHTEETDSNSYFTMKKEYVWVNKQYVVSSLSR